MNRARIVLSAGLYSLAYGLKDLLNDQIFCFISTQLSSKLYFETILETRL